jgi:hypothetical protein
MLGALGHDGRAQARAEIVGQFVQFGVAIDLDGFAGGIADNIAVVAPREVIVKFGPGAGVERAIQVVRKLV